jgi:tRNA threonylcarbamoyladenosine biosynthesis protein TsaB
VIVLGIETATTVCGAAVAAEGRILGHEYLDQPFAHAERLFAMIDDVMRSAGIEKDRLQGVAVSIGPGSFTGLRIGLSAAKGLVVGLKIPLAGISTLGALASHAAALSEPAPGERVLAVLDARRDEVYSQLFRPGARGVIQEGEVRNVAVTTLRVEMRETDLLITGDGSAKLLQSANLGSGHWRAAHGEAARCSAASVALLGERRLTSGDSDDPATLEPKYIKEFFLTSR